MPALEDGWVAKAQDRKDIFIDIETAPHNASKEKCSDWIHNGISVLEIRGHFLKI